MRIFLIGVVLAIAMLAAGCDSAGKPEADAPKATPGFKAVIIEYGGRELHCVERRGYIHGQYSGLTCDFVRWHEEAE